MDRRDHVDSQLKPVLLTNSSIINNSGSETDSSDDSRYKEKSKTNHSKKNKSATRERSKHHHKSRRSRSRNHHSSRSKRTRSRNRSRSDRKDSNRRNSPKSDHRRHRRKRSRSSKDNHSPKRSHKDSRRDRDSNNCKESITRASKIENDKVVDDRVVSGGASRPRKSLFKRNEELAKKTEELTGIKIPSYLNTTVLNPIKYAETEQKRKLLWSKKDDSKKLNILAWNASSVIASRGDDRKAAKFRKLMGIHDDEPTLANQNSQDLSRKEHEQAVLFSRLDADYQSARSQTHTSRGVGLGYNQSAYIDPSAYLAGRREEN